MCKSNSLSRNTFGDAGEERQNVKMALRKVKGNLERMFDKNLTDLVRGIRNNKETEVRKRTRLSKGWNEPRVWVEELGNQGKMGRNDGWGEVTETKHVMNLLVTNWRIVVGLCRYFFFLNGRIEKKVTYLFMIVFHFLSDLWGMYGLVQEWEKLLLFLLK